MRCDCGKQASKTAKDELKRQAQHFQRKFHTAHAANEKEKIISLHSSPAMESSTNGIFTLFLFHIFYIFPCIFFPFLHSLFLLPSAYFFAFFLNTFFNSVTNADATKIAISKQMLNKMQMIRQQIEKNP